jgi:hypothetical protein
LLLEVPDDVGVDTQEAGALDELVDLAHGRVAEGGREGGREGRREGDEWE